MMSENEVFRIVGKKRWESFCIFAKVTTAPDPDRTFDPEQISLYCRLRGIPLRTPVQGKKFAYVSRNILKTPRKKQGRPPQTLEWDITQKSVSPNQTSSKKE